jgi:hypothetical protein
VKLVSNLYVLVFPNLYEYVTNVNLNCLRGWEVIIRVAVIGEWMLDQRIVRRVNWSKRRVLGGKIGMITKLRDCGIILEGLATVGNDEFWRSGTGGRAGFSEGGALRGVVIEA